MPIHHQHNSRLQRLFRRALETRARTIATFLAPHLPARGAVLDFGSGDGLVARTLARVNGVDILTLDVVDYRMDTGTPFEIYAGGALPFADNAFETVLAIFALHHTENPCFYLRELARVSRGTLLILEDSYRNAAELVVTRWLDRLGNFIESREVAVPCNFLTEMTWAAHFEELGLAVAHRERFYNHPLSYVVPRHVFYKLEKGALV